MAKNKRFAPKQLCGEWTVNGSENPSQFKNLKQKTQTKQIRFNQQHCETLAIIL